ncbi:MAG TPA: branched-chain-amino-acid transaminase [bacterium]|nr:branched-chain-amino-acid transaminase [bacterium]HOL49147.1 branched-chain-amino-acid transaminase [bacterium]HPO51564.1 branched-chain-amino-acid transaminase [bacterium]HXK44352.1 branched-chain-amino-acid transaminase [bacterium]
MGLWIYLDGKFVDEKHAKISVFDHGLLYGDGVFEGLRSYDGKIFRLSQHIKRLYKSAKAILLEIPVSMEEMAEIIKKTIKKNKLKDSYIRVVVTRGVGDLGLDPRKCPEPTIFVIASKIKLYPEEYYEKGLSVVTIATRRNLTESLNPAIKSLNYLNNILAKIEATNAGAMEGLFLNNEGYVAECTGENIFIVVENKLFTPPIFAGALDGISRDAVIQIGREIGLDVEEKLLTRYDLYNSDECFLTGTAAEIIPVTLIDGRTIGSGKLGPLTRRIREEFHRLVQKDGTPI